MSPGKSFINFLNSLPVFSKNKDPIRVLDPNETFNFTDKSFSVHETETDGQKIIFQDFTP